MSSLYQTIGDLCQYSPSYRDARNRIDMADVVDVNYDGDLDELAKNRTCLLYFRYGSKYTPLCLTLDEAENFAAKMGFDLEYCRYYYAYVSKRAVFPKELPIEVYLERNERGLYCKMDLRPDLTGGFSSKFYFPDRNNKNKLCEGRCIIESVSDHGNYGFFIGHMVQYEQPSEEAIANTLTHEPYLMHGNYEVRFLTGPFGKVVAIAPIGSQTPAGVGVVYIKSEDGNTRTAGYLAHVLGNCSGNDIVATERIPVQDFLCQGYLGCSMKDLSSRIVRVPFKITRGTRCTHYYTDLLDDVIDDGIMTLREYSNADYIVVDDAMLVDLVVKYSGEEIEEVIDTVNKINREAILALSAQVKKGRITLDSVL